MPYALLRFTIQDWLQLAGYWPLKTSTSGGGLPKWDYLKYRFRIRQHRNVIHGDGCRLLPKSQFL
jgi:hypothetical protein